MKYNFQLRLLSLSKYNFQLTLLLVFLVISCQVKHDGTAKIRGKIVNPRTDEVVISRDFLLLESDTIKLNSQNQLSGMVKVPVEGLYIFFIFPEFQTIYLKPGDSLAVHLNVDEFDESMSFSGSLAFENNLLIDIFLANERENNYFYDHHFQFDEESFNQKLDSFEAEKNMIIENYRDEYQQTSSKYKEILTLFKNSVYYNLKEDFALKNMNISFPEDYFSYRSVLQKKLADPNVIYMNYFTDSFLEYKMKSNREKVRNPYLELSYLIDNEVYDSEFKDNLLAKYCIRYINRFHISKQDTVVNNFYQKMKNVRYKSFCDKIIANNQLMHVDNAFPKGDYITMQKHKISSDSLFKSGTKSLVVFWDLRFQKNFLSNLKKLKKYQEQYPDLQYVLINTNAGQVDEWYMQLPDMQNIRFVQAVNAQQIQMIRPYSLAQIYLLDGQIIKASKINMYEPAFELELERFYTGIKSN